MDNSGEDDGEIESDDDNKEIDGDDDGYDEWCEKGPGSINSLP